MSDRSLSKLAALRGVGCPGESKSLRSICTLESLKSPILLTGLGDLDFREPDSRDVVALLVSDRVGEGMASSRLDIRVRSGVCAKVVNATHGKPNVWLEVDRGVASSAPSTWEYCELSGVDVLSVLSVYANGCYGCFCGDRRRFLSSIGSIPFI
jgi:hypothetical protein